MTITVTGGVVSTDGGYTIHTFETSGTLTIAGGTLTNVDCLLIAGGGSAYNRGTYRAGGGAGGVLENFNIDLPAGSYPVVIGGAFANSTFNGQTAIKGGAAGFFQTAGSRGGSGGGSTVAGPTHRYIPAGQGIQGQGFNGGQGGLKGYPQGSAGGGGGAGGAGYQGGIDFGKPGAGGPGIPSTITGTEVWYAGGGGAYTGDVCAPDGIGRDNYGGGGGYGAGHYQPPNAGVLILRYPTL